MLLSSFHGWPDGGLLDTADTGGSFNSGDHDVTLISPSWSPGVSDDVVLLSILNTISDGGDGVIEVGSASGGVENTTGVTLESHLVGLNGNGNWSLSDSSDELSGRSWLNVVVGGNVDGWISDLGRLAGSGLSVSGGVWVLGFKNLSVLLDVFHTLVLPTTLASIAGSIAENELLLGEAQKVSTFLDELGGLHGGGG